MTVSDDPIRSPGVLVCEGRDDFAFFLSMLAALGIGRDLIDVRPINGRWQLHAFLNGLPITDRRKRLRALGVVCDADIDDGETAFGRVRSDLLNTGYREPTSPGQFVRGPWAGGSSLALGVYIMPDNRSPGALEDLCLSAVTDDPALPCVDSFLDCVATAGGIVWRPQDRAKARLNSWLASRTDPTLLLGHAMNANEIDRSHVAFGPIKDFLSRLAEAARQPEQPPPYDTGATRADLPMS